MKSGNLLNELPYWEVLDGAVINANGTAEIGVRLEPRPSLTQSEDDLERLKRGLQSILRELVPQGERLRLLVQCRPGGLATLETYRNQSVKHPALELLTRSRLELFERLYKEGKLLEWDFTVTLTVGKPRMGTAPFLPLLALSKLFPNLAQRPFVTFSEEELLALLEEARGQRAALVAAFRNLGWRATAMTSEEATKLIFQYLNPELHAVALPPYQPTARRYPELETMRDHRLAPSSLRSRLAKVDMDNGDRHQLWLGSRIVRVLAMHARPDQTAMGMANSLLAMNGHGWYIADFNHVDQGKTTDALKDQERTYRGVVQSAVQLFDSNAKVASEELGAFNEAITRSGEHAYTVAAQLHLIGSREAELSERISEAISRTSSVPGSPFKVCAYNTWTPFLSALPFSGLRMDSSVLLRDGNAAAFFPSEGPLVTGMNPSSVFQTAWGTLLPVDLDDRDLRNRNTLIVGESGSGKSVSMQILISDELARHERIHYTIIEKGESYSSFIAALGDDAVRIPLDPGQFAVNPLELPEGAVEASAEKVAYVVNLVKSMIFERDEPQSAIKSAVLSAAVEQTYRRKTVTRFEGGEARAVFKGARLSDVRETLQLMDEVNGATLSGAARAVADELALKLTDWTGDSAKGRFFDRETSVPFLDKKVVLYDTSPLEGFKDMKVVAIMVMAQLITERWRDDPGIVKRVAVDEAHDIAKLSAGFDFLDDHQRRCRAANGAQILISQTLSEFIRRTEDGEKSLLENISVFVVYPISTREDAILRSHAGMTPEALEAVHDLRSKSGEFSEAVLWFKGRGGVTGSRVRVRLSNADRWMFSSDPYDKAKRAEVMAQLGGDALEAVTVLSGARPRP